MFAVSFPDLAAITNILTVAVGLGLVIFFHELGHFLVAKWCGVYVERFSIGFGHPILSKKYGETEYAIGWLPFGGYVKMMGQDDMDPGQMTDDQVSQDPRAYSAKSVPQRMAIISAGVIMNIITAIMFFMIAVGFGVEAIEPVVGSVQVGMPAWEKGLRKGDRLTEINGKEVNDFSDILRGIALSRGPIDIKGVHADGQTFQTEIVPEKSGVHRMIGVGQPLGLTLPESSPDAPWLTRPGTPAARAKLESGDVIIKVDGEPVTSNLQLTSHFAQHVQDEVELTVRRKGNANAPAGEATVRLYPEKFRTLGLKMSMGKVVALRDESVAAQAGIREGDRITKVDDLDVEQSLDPYRLTEYFTEHAGTEVKVTVSREVQDGAPEQLTLTLTPEQRDAWGEAPEYPGSSISVPSIGLAYSLVPNVFSVEAEGPAAKGGINPRDTITSVVMKSAPGAPEDEFEGQAKTINVATDGWPFAFWMMQERGRNRSIELKVKTAEGGLEKTISIDPQESADWYVPTTRGLLLTGLTTKHKAESFSQAAGMGWRYTTNSVMDIYLTLRGLLTRDISPKGLSGPIGIGKIAYQAARVGLAYFVLFLGLISVNLAVINFLPIPVLDGGHMVFLLWEGITRRKPNGQIVGAATYFGLIFILSLMLFVIYQDLFVPKQ